MSDNDSRHDNSGVRFPPPLYYVIGLVIGFAIQYFFPLHFSKAGHQPILYTLGAVWIGLGLLLFAWALITFRRAGTSPIPHRPSTVLVPSGPYKLTRNPIYLAFALISVGISLLGNAIWPLLSVPVTLLLIDRLVIRKEERYLEVKFGDAYRQYKTRARRWI